MQLSEPSRKHVYALAMRIAVSSNKDAGPQGDIQSSPNNITIGPSSRPREMVRMGALRLTRPPDVRLGPP
jgi:hypothetical protein